MHNQVLSSAESFTCFLAICCDGTSIYRNKNISFWPIQLMILNLPIHLRHKTYNMVLYSICSGKPDWNIVFKNLELLQDSYICLPYNMKSLKIKISVNFLMCDLPALASVLNFTQFNGY